MFRKCLLAIVLVIAVTAVTNFHPAYAQEPGRPTAPPDFSLLSQERQGLDFEQSRLERRAWSLKLRMDAISVRSSALDRQRPKLRSRADIQAFNRRIKEYNQLLEQFNFDRRVFLDDLADWKQRAANYTTKVQAASNGTNNGTGGGLYFDENAPKRRP